jgi:hypothetical protein
VEIEKSDHKPRAATGHEFDRALLQAESLLHQADEGQGIINRYAAALGVSWSITVIAATLILVSAGVSGTGIWIGATAVVIVNLILTWFVRSQLVQPLRYAVQRDERCAVEIVDMLRELLPFLARDERWSLFRTERSRARIARFPIAARSSQ